MVKLQELLALLALQEPDRQERMQINYLLPSALLAFQVPLVFLLRMTLEHMQKCLLPELTDIPRLFLTTEMHLIPYGQIIMCLNRIDTLLRIIKAPEIRVMTAMSG